MAKSHAIRASVGRLERSIAQFAAIILIASPAFADGRRVGSKAPGDGQSEAAEWDIEGSIALVSDYRSAGISLSGGDPVIQGDIEITHQSGLFVRAWASRIAPDDGGWAEFDLSAGLSQTIGEVQVSIGATAYLYPGVPNSAYVESLTEFDVPVGDATLTLGAAWTPKQANVPRSNLYLAGVIEWPVRGTPIIVDAALGREDVAFGDRKVDWLVGGRYRLRHFDLGLAYVDSRRAFAAHSGPALIASVAWRFRRAIAFERGAE